MDSPLHYLFQSNPTETQLDEDIFKSFEEIRVPDQVGVVAPTKAYLQGLPLTLGNNFGAYLGSQSHPPCRRGVYWLIAQQTYKVAKDKVRWGMSLEGGGNKKGNII